MLLLQAQVEAVAGRVEVPIREPLAGRSERLERRHAQEASRGGGKDRCLKHHKLDQLVFLLLLLAVLVRGRPSSARHALASAGSARHLRQLHAWARVGLSQVVRVWLEWMRRCGSRAHVLAGFAVASRSGHSGDSHRHALSCRSRLPPAAPARVRVRWLCLRCRAVVRCACVCVLRLSSPSPSRWLLFSACPRHLARWASSTALPTCCRPPEPAGIPYIPQWMHLPSSVSPRRARGHARGTSRRPCGRLMFSAVSWRAPLQ